MEKEKLIEKIISKKEFSDLPKKDVELVFGKFDKGNYSDEEKIKLSRDLLRKMYTVFLSTKLLNPKDKNPEWFLKKHLSTKERFENYEEVYQFSLEDLSKELTLFDLGCGVNGFSYRFFKKIGFNVNYIGVEAVGQLVEIQKDYFEKNKLNGSFFKRSLFDLEEIESILKKGKRPKVVFLFKTLDSLEMLKRDYSKVLLKAIVHEVERVVVSYATKSLGRGKKFFAKREWLKNFIKENFEIIKESQIGNEYYIIFSKKDL